MAKDHRRLVADMATRMGKPGLWVFVFALRAERGMESPNIEALATDEYHQFLKTNEAPRWVENFCLDYLRRSKATRKCLDRA